LSTEQGGPSELSARATAAMRAVLDLLAADAGAPTSVRVPERAWRVHVADSLSGLEVRSLRDAKRIADLGAGAGFPGLPLALALPGAHLDLLESNRRKCEFLGRALERAALGNARVVCKRSEAWAAKGPPAGGREA
jgi:16S rRNA (guanine527-N7)-methyltransferase